MEIGDDDEVIEVFSKQAKEEQEVRGAYSESSLGAVRTREIPGHGDVIVRAEKRRFTAANGYLN